MKAREPLMIPKHQRQRSDAAYCRRQRLLARAQRRVAREADHDFNAMRRGWR